MWHGPRSARIHSLHFDHILARLCSPKRRKWASVMRYAGRSVLVRIDILMKHFFVFGFTSIVISAIALAQSGPVIKPDTVVVRTDTVLLLGLVWRPMGEGPFPAILFNQGRSTTIEERTTKTSQASLLGELFSKHGYLFFVLFRQGEGLSVNRGFHISQLLDRERITHGANAADFLQVQLLQTRELTDALAGVAFLKSIPGVDPGRLGLVGHSFGGSLALLIAARDTALKATVDFSGAAGSWNIPSLRNTLIGAVKRLTSPVLFLFASNDYSVEPGKALDAELEREGKVHQLRIFPPFGKTATEGHSFVYSAIDQWDSAVFALLDAHLKH